MLLWNCSSDAVFQIGKQLLGNTWLMDEGVRTQGGIRTLYKCNTKPGCYYTPSIHNINMCTFRYQTISVAAVLQFLSFCDIWKFGQSSRGKVILLYSCHWDWNGLSFDRFWTFCWLMGNAEPEVVRNWQFGGWRVLPNPGFRINCIVRKKTKLVTMK